MNICPITYEETTNKYSAKGLKLLSRNLSQLRDLPFTKEELLSEAKTRATKLSIQGVQPKLSVILNTSKESFEIVDSKGKFIIKPQNDLFNELPENEDLTMRMAKSVGLEIPLHGLVYCNDGSVSYFIKRFDRIKKNKKLSLEDFAQLSGASRETKYKSSMERVAKIILDFCTFPAVESVKLFRLVLFNFLTGNEDAHLKNFSLITRNNIISLSPFYDLVNSTIALKQATEELALPLNGRKNKLRKKDLIDYFGKDVLGLNTKVINQNLEILKTAVPEWENLISISFLSNIMKEKYHELLKSRLTRLFT